MVLPDDLLMEAKTLAVGRKTTLKAIIEAALRREIRPSTEQENPDPSRFEVGPLASSASAKRPAVLPPQWLRFAPFKKRWKTNSLSG